MDIPMKIYQYMSMSTTTLEVGVAVIVVVVPLLMACCCCCCCRKEKPVQRSSQPSRVTLERAVRKTSWEISKHLRLAEIGENFNEWRRPVGRWGYADTSLKRDYGQYMDVESDKWRKATQIVDYVMSMMLSEMKSEAESYNGLSIVKFVKQGSSREGLKVEQPDEFDLLLLFDICGLQLKARNIETMDGAYELPEFCQLEAPGSGIEYRYPTLYSNQVLMYDRVSGKVTVNSRNLQEKVFKSIVQRAANSVQKRVNMRDVQERFSFEIGKFRINPPSINIQIYFNEIDPTFDTRAHFARLQCESRRQESASRPVGTIIDIDIVPGLLLRNDTIPDPTNWNQTMKCPRYAVFKWYTDNQPPAARYDSRPDFLWRVCSSGYEKHVLDVARGSDEQYYIITALRILKYEFQRRKKENNPQQLFTVVRSYYLKHVAFYCILYLTVINKANLSGVRDALAYFLEFLQVALEESRLPHFFHGNANLIYMFPDYEISEKNLRYNLFIDKSSDALAQAICSLVNLKLEMKTNYLTDVTVFDDFHEKFRSYIRCGKYYDGYDFVYD